MEADDLGTRCPPRSIQQSAHDGGADAELSDATDEDEDALEGGAFGDVGIEPKAWMLEHS